jgi:hypothetical protein
VGRRDLGREVEDLVAVLRLALVELGAEDETHRWPGGHHDPGSRATDARLPGALRRDLLAVGVVLLDGLAEVPDVALAILRVPVVRDLLEPAVDDERARQDSSL